MPQYKLTYFDTPGYAEPMRYLFHLAGKPFEDVRFTITADRGLPPGVKETLRWGQVPVLHVDGKEIAQSSAICRYLAREFGFCGANNYEAAKCDEIVDASRDFLTAYTKYFGEKDEAKKAELKKNGDDVVAPEFLGRMTKLIKENGEKWLVGDKVTWADLIVSNFAEIFDVVFSGSADILDLDKYPVVKAHMLRVFALPQIKKFREATIIGDPQFKRKY